MIIDIPKISEEGTAYEGEEPGEILALENDRLAHADGPIVYRLFVQRLAQELVVQGTLRAPVKLLCGRCAGFFSTTLEVSSFLRAYPIAEQQETVDLTEDIREDILLEIPLNSKCSWEGEGICPFSGEDLAEMRPTEPPAGDERWGALDHLKE